MRSIYICTAILSLLPGCKAEEETVNSQQDDVEVYVAKQAEKVGFYADSTPYLRRNEDFFFRVWNESFTRRLVDMPRDGEVKASDQPYSGYWYPENQGGTNVLVSGNQSPLQKYDAAFHGGDDKATRWEIEKHSGDVSWAGHCNGFSASSQRHPREPFRNVTKNGVTFTPHDIKALLAEVHMSADFEFLGGNRCELEGESPTPGDRADPTVMGECEDINPGTLHAAIANWIGRMRHTLIMDQYTTYQVWNYPLYKYEVLSLDDRLSRTQAMEAITGNSGTYIFNPNAVKYARVQTRLTYATATNQEVLGQLNPETLTLSYILELNGNGEIIGGEWIGQSQQTHPDFLWVALPPTEPNGTRFLGNPHVDADEVIRLWAEATDQDPDNPKLDIERPASDINWGRWANFEVTLDGGQRGAVFAGKVAKMVVEPRAGGPLASSDVALEVILNGETVKEIDSDDTSDLRYSFDPSLGLNRFQFIWTRGTEELETRYLRFLVVP